MEYEGEERNMHYAEDYTENGEQERDILNVNDLLEQSTIIENQIQESFNNDSVQLVSHSNEMMEQALEPLYKLNNVDTESSVKWEIKQSIFTRVSDETNSKILNDTWAEMRDQIKNLTIQQEQLSNENQKLDREIETDERTLAQFVEILSKSDAMIVSLKEDLTKLDVQQKKSSINNYLEKSVAQAEKVKEINISNLNEKHMFETVEITTDNEIEKLKSESTYKRNALASLKKKQIELEQVVSSIIRDIEYKMAQHDELARKLASVTNSKENVNNKFLDQTNVIYSKNENQVDRLSNLNKMKAILEQEIEELVTILEQTGINMDNEKQISEQQMRKDKLEDHLETLKHSGQKKFQNLRQNFDDVEKRLHEVLSAATNCKAENDDLLIEMRNLNVIFIHKVEEKSMLMNTTMQRQNNAFNIKMELLQKEAENEVLQKKFDQLKKEYEASGVLLNSLEDNITKEKENVDREIIQLKTKLLLEQSEINKSSIEIKKKKEYVLANAKALEEKSDNLRKVGNEIENNVKNVENKNSHIKVLLERKQLRLNELNRSLAAKRNQESALKSGFKMPNRTNVVKKVKFSEVVSFKSTSSDNSSIPVDDTTHGNPLP